MQQSPEGSPDKAKEEYKEALRQQQVPHQTQTVSAETSHGPFISDGSRMGMHNQPRPKSHKPHSTDSDSQTGRAYGICTSRVTALQVAGTEPRTTRARRAREE